MLGRTLDELPPQTRTLLGRVHAWAEAECARLAMKRADLRFTRRRLRDVTGWGDTQLKVHLGRLAELEYLLIHRVKAGQGYEYELLYDGEGDTGGRFVMGLAGPDAPTTHVCDAERSAPTASRSGSGRDADGPRSVGGRVPETGSTSRKTAVPDDGSDTLPEMPRPVLNGSAASYRQTVIA